LNTSLRMAKICSRITKLVVSTYSARLGVYMFISLTARSINNFKLRKIIVQISVTVFFEIFLISCSRCYQDVFCVNSPKYYNAL